MGLDMYLFDPKTKEQIFYWRKANAIHHWIEKKIKGKEIENLEEIEIKLGDLKKLLEDINAVLNKEKKPEEVLPTASGFFWGSTEYDDWYYYELKATKNFIEQLIPKHKNNKKFVYKAWW